MKKSVFRTKLLIYPKFQLLLIGINSSLAICAFVITLMEVRHQFSNFIELGKTIKLSPEHAYFRMIQLQENKLILSLVSAFLITLILSALITLVISHRISGPIVRMKSYLKEIARLSKVETKLSFRKGDFFDDLPQDLNRAFDAVSRNGK